MIKKIFTITMLITAYGAHAMDEAMQKALAEVSTERITTPEQLQEGINLSSGMFDEIFKKSPLEIPGQSRYSKEHRAERLEQLQTKPNRNDVFFKRNGETIGFVATHLDETNPDRVILDKGFIGTPDNRKVVGAVMILFIKKTYPQAQSVWCATPKQNAGSEKLVGPAGFTKSDFMDDLHDAQFCQGWERSLKQ